MALPPKKHRRYERSESARRGELPKSQVLVGGDKRAYPRRAVPYFKTKFYSRLKNRRFSTLISSNLQKETTETLFFNNASAVFYWLCLNAKAPFFSEVPLAFLNSVLCALRTNPVHILRSKIEKLAFSFFLKKLC